MKTYTIHQDSQYRIDSHGNGFAYTILRKADSRAIVLQGEDASAVERDTAEFTNLDVLVDYFDCLFS